MQKVFSLSSCLLRFTMSCVMVFMLCLLSLSGLSEDVLTVSFNKDANLVENEVVSVQVSDNVFNLKGHAIANSATWHGPLEIRTDCTIKNGTIRNNSLTGDALVTITGGNVVFEDVTFDCSGCSPQALVHIAFGSQANVTFKGNCRFLTANKDIDAIYVDYCSRGKVTFDDSFTGVVGGKITLAHEASHPGDDPYVAVSIAGFGTFENVISLDGGAFDFHNSSVSITGGRFAVMPNSASIAPGFCRESDGAGYWSICADESGDLSSPLTWVTSRDEAFAQARAKGKKVFLLSGFNGTYGTEETRTNSCESVSVKRYLKRDYVCWYNDIDTQFEESQKYLFSEEVGNVLPFLVIIDADADERLTAEGGPHDADALRVMLGRVAREVKFTPESGTRFVNSTQVSLSAQSGAFIYYTLDGTLPTASSIRYERPITVTSGATIRAIAYVGGVLGLPVDAEFVEARKASSGGYEWTADVIDGGCVIASVSPKPTGAISIPAKIGGLDVVGFAKDLLQSNEEITSVFIPASVKEISASQFTGCSRLATISVDAANARYSSHGGIVYDKAREVLVCCPAGVERLEIPYGVKEIAPGSCQRLAGLSDVVIPSSVTTIGDEAFFWCSQLEAVAIPESVTNIGNYAFTYCQNLGDAWLPAHLEADVIQNHSFWTGFYGCEVDLHYYSGTLSQITIRFNASGGNLENADRMYTVAGDKIIAADFPVPTRFDNTFIGWFTATYGGNEVTVEASVTGDMALYAHWRRESYEWGYEEKSDGSVTVTSVSPANGSVAIPAQIDGKPVTAIGFAAFANCHGLVAVKLPASVTNIEYAAFWNCSSLESVVFEGDENAVSIHGGAFAYTPYEESRPFEWIVNDGVLTGFRGICPAEAVLPESVKAIGPDVFYLSYHPAAENLRRVIFNVGLETIGANAFRESGLTEIVLPSTVKTIGDSAFYGCCSLTNIVLNEGLLTIRAGAFGGGTTTEIMLPSSMAEMPREAFLGTEGTVTVHAPWSLWGTLESGEVHETGDSGVTTRVDVEFYGDRPNVYTVAFNVNGGTALSESNRSVMDGHSIGSLPVPTKTGCLFLGWFTSANGGEQVRPETVVRGNMELYAHWGDLPFSATGGDAEWMADVDGSWRSGAITHDQNTWFEVDVTNAPCRVSFKWKTSSESVYDLLYCFLDGEEVVPAISGEMPDWETVSFEIKGAEWHTIRFVYVKDNIGSGGEDCGWVKDFEIVANDVQPVTYTVTYAPGKYGSGSMQTDTKVKDVPLTLRGALFTTEGHRQNGWSTANPGTKEYELGAQYTSNASVTLYPTWDANAYTIHFDANGGSGTMADMAMRYAVPTNLSANIFTKNGCTFAGWATNANGGVVYEDGARVKNLTAEHGVAVTLYAIWIPENVPAGADVTLTAGKYFYATLAGLGFDVPTNDTPYLVTALGLPAGLKLVSNAAVKDKKGNVIKKAKTEWWIEGVPTAGLDFLENPPYLVITANGVAETYALPMEVLAQDVTELGTFPLGTAWDAQSPLYLPGVTNSAWTVSGLPTGLKYTAKLVTTVKKSGKKVLSVTTNALPCSVYGKTTKAGLFTITAKKKVGSFYETMKYHVLVTPKLADATLFGDSFLNITTMAYVPLEWNLVEGGMLGECVLPSVAAVGGKVAKVTGLPAGLAFAAANVYADKKKTKLKQAAQTITGTPTKPGTYAVTFTKNVTTGTGKNKKTVAKTAQILWTVVANEAELSIGFNTSGGVIESGVVGLRYGNLLTFSATEGAKVTASGLPAGMKLARLGGPLDEAALPGEAMWGFEGYTTKAGTYLVTVTATLNGKTITQRLALKVEGLPDWAKGAFNGYVTGRSGGSAVPGDGINAQAARSTNGLATVTVSAAGKISGKIHESGTNWVLSAASYTARSASAPYQGGVDFGSADVFTCTNVVATYSYKGTTTVKGKKKTVTKKLTRAFTLVVLEDGLGGVAACVETSPLSGTKVDAWQNLWGRADYKALGKILFSTNSGKKKLAYKTFTFKGTDEKGAAIGLTSQMSLSLKVTTAGAVSASMTFDTGKTQKDPKTKKTVKVYYKPICSTVVLPTSSADAEPFTGAAFLYFAPSPANSFPGWIGSVPWE